MPLRVAILLLLAVVAAQAAEIKGRVTNAVSGEALERVEVALLETNLHRVTSKDGEFDIPNLSPGKYTLRLNAVSYRLLKLSFSLAAPGDIKEFSITMVPETFTTPTMWRFTATFSSWRTHRPQRN
jgi:hypothetical protein